MIPTALKTAMFFSLALAAYLAANYFARRSGTVLREKAALRRAYIMKEAELAGIDLHPAVSAAISPFGPAAVFVFRKLRGRRLVKIDSMIPELLWLLGSALKAGLSLPQAIEMAAGEIDGPLGLEISKAALNLRLGQTLGEALDNFYRRVPTEDAGLFVQSVETLRQTGGNLVETFSSLAKTIEDRRRVKDKIRVLTATGIYQGAFLLAMPWLLGFLLYAIAPEYIEPLITTRVGLLFAALGVLLEFAGGLWLKKIVMIRV